MGLVASQARNSGELEKVIPYAPGRSVRTDVYVETRDGVRLIEIEQALDSNNKDRAVAKLKGYAELFATNPPDLIPELMIIFNLPKSNLEHTLKVWQLALRDAGDLPFPIYTSTLEIFMYMPDFSNWSTLDRLSASEKKRRPAEPLNIPGEIPHENPLEGLDPAPTLTSRAETIRARMSVVTDFDAARRFDLLGRFAWSFYEPDFNEHTGQTLLYNADPVNSLGSLREFLYDPRHKPLFELMKRKAANFRKQTTITVQMTAALEMAWSFLSAFGLKEGGPLNVYANAPMVGDNADRLQYKLDLENNRFEVDEKRKEEYQKAILWLLNTFLFYPRELGLVDEPRKQR